MGNVKSTSFTTPIKCWECDKIIFNAEIIVESGTVPDNYLAVFHKECRSKATLFDVLETPPEKMKPPVRD